MALGQGAGVPSGLPSAHQDEGLSSEPPSLSSEGLVDMREADQVSVSSSTDTRRVYSPTRHEEVSPSPSLTPSMQSTIKEERMLMEEAGSLDRGSECCQTDAEKSNGTAACSTSGTQHATQQEVVKQEGEAAASHPAASSSEEEPVQWQVGRCYPVIPGKLYFASHLDDEHSRSEIANKPRIFFFSSDLHERYNPLCADFGPVHLGIVLRFGELVHSRMKDSRLQNRVLVYYTSVDLDHITNCAFLFSAYLLIAWNMTPEESVKPFVNFHPYSNPVVPFRDATYTRSTFDLTLLDCAKAIDKALNVGWLQCDQFNIEEYESNAHPLNGDMHVICDKFIAFKGPTDSPKDAYTFTPSQYIEVFMQQKVTAVIRLNEASTYNPAPFIQNGMAHHDLYFVDCTVPSVEIVAQFLKIVEETEGKVAVHCLAGLGRTGTLICLWMMKHFGATSVEALGWIRIVRPGSVIGPQQHFLAQFDGFDWSRMDAIAESALGKRPGGAMKAEPHKLAKGEGADGSVVKLSGRCDQESAMAAEMAAQVAHGMNERARAVGVAEMQLTP